MTIPRLPAETCDRIIDHLHTEKLALNACALVCRAWLPSARLHRFRRIELSRFVRRREPMLKLLSDPRSTFLRYVRELQLEEHKGRPTWLDHTALSQIPHERMPNLESITIIDLGWYNWNELPYVRPLSEQTLECLKDLCRSAKRLSLVSPRTDSILPLLELLSGIEALDRLSMITAERYQEFNPDMMGGLQCPGLASLRHLELDRRSYALIHALEVLCPSLLLRSFVIGELRDDAVESFWHFVGHVGETLEHLELSIDDWDDGRINHAETIGRTLANGLGCCRSLATISLGIHTEPYQKVRVAMAAYDLLLDEIQRLFSSLGPLSAAKLVVVGHDRDLAVLIELRGMLFERLSALRDEGRLEFKRGDGESMDPAKQRSVQDDIDEFFS